MTTTLFVPVEKPVRDWLRDQNLAVIADRVYAGGLPADATYPAVEVLLLDSGIQPGEAPVANAYFSFNVWAAGTTGADRTEAAAVTFALASLLQSARHAVLDDDLVLHGAQIVLGPQPRYDADGTPRYVIDATLTLVKVA